MSVAAFRIRKRLVEYAKPYRKGSDVRDALMAAIDIIDEELEAEAERQFTRPINPDPVSLMSYVNKEDK